MSNSGLQMLGMVVVWTAIGICATECSAARRGRCPAKGKSGKSASKLGTPSYGPGIVHSPSPSDGYWLPTPTAPSPQTTGPHGLITPPVTPDTEANAPAQPRTPVPPLSPDSGEPDPLENLFDGQPSDSDVPPDDSVPPAPPIDVREGGAASEFPILGEPAPILEEPAPSLEEPDAADDADQLFEDLFGEEDDQQSQTTNPNVDPSLVMRRWVDDSGLYSVHGRLIEILDGQVRLLQENGRTCTVTLRRLSDADVLVIQKAQTAYGMGLIAQNR